MTKVEGRYKHGWVICHELRFRKLSWRCQFSRHTTYILLDTLVICWSFSFIGTFVSLFIYEILRLRFILKTQWQMSHSNIFTYFLYMITVVFFISYLLKTPRTYESTQTPIWIATVIKRELAIYWKYLWSLEDRLLINVDLNKINTIG